jgi:hypothetical protein
MGAKQKGISIVLEISSRGELMLYYLKTLDIPINYKHIYFAFSLLSLGYIALIKG